MFIYINVYLYSMNHQKINIQFQPPFQQPPPPPQQKKKTAIFKAFEAPNTGRPKTTENSVAKVQKPGRPSGKPEICCKDGPPSRS